MIGFGRVGEDVQVDVGALADVAGEHAADQPRAKRREPPHHGQRGEPHVAQVVGAAVAFVEPGERLNLVADFDVAGQVGRLDPALADLPGRLHFGAVVFRLLPVVHQPGGFPGDLPPQFRAIHRACAVSPSDRRGHRVRDCMCQLYPRWPTADGHAKQPACDSQHLADERRTMRSPAPARCAAAAGASDRGPMLPKIVRAKRCSRRHRRHRRRCRRRSTVRRRAEVGLPHGVIGVVDVAVGVVIAGEQFVRHDAIDFAAADR